MKAPLIMLLLCALLAGCVALPPAETVATSCERAYKEVEGKARGNSRHYRESIQAKCIDDTRHRTTAKDELELKRGQVTTSAEYDAREGDNRTRVENETSVGPKGFKHESLVRGETKKLRWGTRFVVKTR